MPDSLTGHFVMPCGLFLVIDAANGGDITAQEIVKRFQLIHEESGKAIDFYFLGWEWVKPGVRSEGIEFNLKSFALCREALKGIGIQDFGGNADLILVDAHHRFWPTNGGSGISTTTTLDFRKAIHVNLSSRRAASEIPPVGEFLQTIIRVAEDVRDNPRGLGRYAPVVSISDGLGLAIARRSVLEYIYAKWAGIIGAAKLDAVTIRNLGREISVSDLRLSAMSSVDKKIL